MDYVRWYIVAIIVSAHVISFFIWAVILSHIVFFHNVSSEQLCLLTISSWPNISLEYIITRSKANVVLCASFQYAHLNCHAILFSVQGPSSWCYWFWSGRGELSCTIFHTLNQRLGYLRLNLSTQVILDGNYSSYLTTCLWIRLTNWISLFWCVYVSFRITSSVYIK